MHFSLTSLVRLAALFGLALFASAVGISRAVPKPSGFRIAASPRYFGVSGRAFDPPDHRSFLLDAESGTLRPFAPIAGYRVDFANGSPWCDERGEGEVVGRVVPLPESVEEAACDASGLVRFRLSGGPLRRETPGSPVVAGPACWLAGSFSRVVFPAGDGRLYLQDLDDQGDPDAPEDPSRMPKRVTWNCPAPGVGEAFLQDPVCPPVPALDGRIVVALSPWSKAGARRRLGPSEIWWLKLDPSGTSVVDAGRLTPPPQVGRGGRETHERFPNLVVTPDRTVALAYLCREEEGSASRLKLAPVEIEPESGRPFVRRPSVVDLGNDYAATTPVFSTDGRSLLLVSRKGTGGDRVCRVSVVDALRQGSVLAGGPAGALESRGGRRVSR